MEKVQNSYPSILFIKEAFSKSLCPFSDGNGLTGERRQFVNGVKCDGVEGDMSSLLSAGILLHWLRGAREETEMFVPRIETSPGEFALFDAFGVCFSMFDIKGTRSFVPMGEVSWERAVSPNKDKPELWSISICGKCSIAAVLEDSASSNFLKRDV